MKPDNFEARIERIGKDRRHEMKSVGIVLAGGILIVAMGVVSAFAADAAGLYADKCSVCHGPNGEGAQTGQALKGDDFITGHTVEEVKQVILNGRGGADKLHPEVPLDMPGGLVTEEEAGQLAKYVKEDLQK